MPPIHREKSLDEYCSGSSAINTATNKRNIWNSTVTNSLQLSPPPDATRAKRVSEGSSNSNCSSSSDIVETDSLKASPIPKNTFNSEACSVKSDCMYSTNNINSSSDILNTSGEIAFQNGAHNKVYNQMVVKTVLNDIKMETL